LFAQGVITINKSVLLGLFFCPARQHERGVVVLHKRAITLLGKKTGPALRVAAEKTPCRVVRRSFEISKPLSSRLAWRLFSRKRTALLMVITP